jgi:hypothetical protein
MVGHVELYLAPSISGTSRLHSVSNCDLYEFKAQLGIETANHPYGCNVTTTVSRISRDAACERNGSLATGSIDRSGRGQPQCRQR